MLFRRRETRTRVERVKDSVWPRKGWRRTPLYYVKRILRLSGTPYALAMGVAAGVFASFTPFIGFHFLLTFAIAWLLRANMIAGALATFVGNPLTFPFIWGVTYETGRLILEGRQHDAPARLEEELTYRSFDQIWPLVKPMLVGSVPLGLAAGVVVYVLVYKAVSAYQVGRRQRFEEKRRMPQRDGGSHSMAAEPGPGH